MLTILGITGVFTTAVRCGPCLKVALEEDSGQEADTGEEGDTGEDTGKAGDSESSDRSKVTQHVLERGILPDDVASVLAARELAPNRQP